MENAQSESDVLGLACVGVIVSVTAWELPSCAVMRRLVRRRWVKSFASSASFAAFLPTRKINIIKNKENCEACVCEANRQPCLFFRDLLGKSLSCPVYGPCMGSLTFFGNKFSFFERLRWLVKR